MLLKLLEVLYLLCSNTVLNNVLMSQNQMAKHSTKPPLFSTTFFEQRFGGILWQILNGQKLNLLVLLFL